MFLIDRQSSPTSLRVELAPRQLFGGAGSLVGTALMARPAADAGARGARDRTAQLDVALPQPARRRKAG